MNRWHVDIFHPDETGALVFSLDETGTIVSVFDTAVNIRISGGRLVSIVRHAQAMTPMSIHSPALLDHQKFVRKGRPVYFRGGVIAAHDWCMEISGSKKFEGIPEAGQRLSTEERRLERFEKALHFAGQKDGLLGITQEGLSRNAFARKGREIAGKMLSRNSGHYGTHLAAFVGLGLGFTPSGDDLICGFLMGEALDCQFPGASQPAYAPFLDQHQQVILRRTADRTCDAGRTLIWMALQGRFPRFLCQAASELSRAKTTKDMLALVIKATRYGHTSGTDALMGLLLYLKTRRRHIMRNGYLGTAPPFVNQNHISFTG